MKKYLENCLFNTLDLLIQKGDLKEASGSGIFDKIEIEEPKTAKHGDFSANAPLVMAKSQGRSPRDIAVVIQKYFKDPERRVEKIDIAGPGFVNFFIRAEAWHHVLRKILTRGEKFGASDFGNGEKVQVEFVSANPTGPLHVGHGRGAVTGDTLANILAFTGHAVQREYYINDSGRQIRILGMSVYSRYREIQGLPVDFPGKGYQGEYIKKLAEAVYEDKNASLLKMPEDEAVMFCARFAAKRILGGIRNDLEMFGVTFDRWFSEQSLYEREIVTSTINSMKERGLVYEKDGALWFRTEKYGDEKDRVVIRRNGLTTYFASDIAYHFDKYERGFNRVIDVWGADHHGYIPRVTAAVEAGGYERTQFQVVLVKLVNLSRGGVPVSMSTRAGEFVTLKDVINEVGKDAARFLFLTRHTDSPLDFDLELAKQKTSDNPVYYVQYVHARISSILRKGLSIGLIKTKLTGDDWAGMPLTKLSAPEERYMIKLLGRFPEVMETGARFLEPHRIPFYLMDLAGAFHSYYNRRRVLVEDDPELAKARLALITGIRQVIQNGLRLLGVDAPEKM